MAGCDNLYGNRKQWIELHAFFVQTHPEWIGFYMKPQPLEEAGDDNRICYIPEIQQYLIRHCPLVWVKEQLEDNFVIQRSICGKAHHECLHKSHIVFHEVNDGEQLRILQYEGDYPTDEILMDRQVAIDLANEILEIFGEK